ncbi:MAG TPA: hypothetical protein VLR49_15140 [Ferruginibacter sp.]|nr:hypothetical protein [Ferruginibacter sp.]
MIQKVSPILPALNIEETKMFYRGKLNFDITDQSNHLVVYNSNIEIHFYKTTDRYLCENTSCFIFVSNIEDLYLRLSALDIILPAGKLVTKQWGYKEFDVLDNNGNLLRFVEK